MKSWILAVVAVVLAAGPLAAQDVHLGVGVDLGIPTGDFSSSTAGGYSQSYNTNLGARISASFPVDRNLAVRLSLGGTTFTGTAGFPDGTSTNLQDDMFTLGGEAQLFLANGNAARHIGSYLIGGAEVDFERFSASTTDPNFDPYAVANRTRMALVAGFGHSFRTYGRGRWTMEAAYHKTLTGVDTPNGFPPADYLRLSVGMVF